VVPEDRIVFRGVSRKCTSGVANVDGVVTYQGSDPDSALRLVELCGGGKGAMEYVASKFQGDKQVKLACIRIRCIRPAFLPCLPRGQASWVANWEPDHAGFSTMDDWLGEEPFWLEVARRLTVRGEGWHRVKDVHAALVSRYSSPEELAQADLRALRKLLHPLGFRGRHADLLAHFAAQRL